MNHASTKIGGAATARAAGTPSRPAAGTGPAATWQDRAKAVAGLRLALYPRLPPIARSWWARLGRETPWPDSLQEWYVKYRVFFADEETAIAAGYRPCGTCCKGRYIARKARQNTETKR